LGSAQLAQWIWWGVRWTFVTVSIVLVCASLVGNLDDTLGHFKVSECGPNSTRATFFESKCQEVCYQHTWKQETFLGGLVGHYPLPFRISAGTHDWEAKL
jgi:hypothetical protein